MIGLPRVATSGVLPAAFPAVPAKAEAEGPRRVKEAPEVLQLLVPQRGPPFAPGDAQLGSSNGGSPGRGTPLQRKRSSGRTEDQLEAKQSIRFR